MHLTGAFMQGIYPAQFIEMLRIHGFLLKNPVPTCQDLALSHVSRFFSQHIRKMRP